MREVLISRQFKRLVSVQRRVPGPIAAPALARGAGSGAASLELTAASLARSTRGTICLGRTWSSSMAAAASWQPRRKSSAPPCPDRHPGAGGCQGTRARCRSGDVLHAGARDAFKLKPRDPVLYFVQRLRDEAHRFAVGSHRTRRRRDIREAGLQEIPGIGPSRKRALLHHFGTLKAIETGRAG